MLAKLSLCAAVLLVSEVRAETPQASPDEKVVKLIAIERNIIDYTNQERVRYGLQPLKMAPDLVRSARRHAIWMTQNRSLQHTREAVAENIAMGQRDSAEAVGDWMNSPGHRANILNSRYRRIGVAAYRTPEGTIYWCQQFRF